MARILLSSGAGAWCGVNAVSFSGLLHIITPSNQPSTYSLFSVKLIGVIGTLSDIDTPFRLARFALFSERQRKVSDNNRQYRLNECTKKPHVCEGSPAYPFLTHLAAAKHLPAAR
jgi:hypothetical protein